MMHTVKISFPKLAQKTPKQTVQVRSPQECRTLFRKVRYLNDVRTPFDDSSPSSAQSERSSKLSVCAELNVKIFFADSKLTAAVVLVKKKGF